MQSEMGEALIRLGRTDEGFATVFNRNFKQCFALTPTEFREKMKSSDE